MGTDWLQTVQECHAHRPERVQQGRPTIKLLNHFIGAGEQFTATTIAQ